ncbi:MAG: bifunctional diaminohydroxyphosphoribosylaminopyrimidine deaminase/5-amino-6-(5-phosphoribosylamino)uracil reductase RibD [Bdellovibrio sp.]
MRECLKLAGNALGMTAPNPLVGSVIVREHKIIGRGHHKMAGLPHAEVEAINDAIDRVEGATLYCNLEPCCHTKKRTPPCTQFIIEKKIKKVVIGMLDPNPEVSGKGVEILRAAGIEVVVGILEEECRELNRVFIKQMTSNLPYVHVKWAQGINGVMANDEKRLMISNEEALKYGHELRQSYDAILIGRNTLNADDPKLTVRYSNGLEGKSLRKIIIGDLELMKKSTHLFKHDFENLIFVTKNKSIAQNHSQCIGFDEFDWSKVLTELRSKFGIHSILVEGGIKTNESLLNSGLIDRVSILTSPTAFEGRGISKDHYLKLNDFKKVIVKELGHNQLTEYMN